MDNIRQQKISGDNVYRFLLFFEGAEVENMRWDNETTVERVIMLIREH